MQKYKYLEQNSLARFTIVLFSLVMIINGITDIIGPILYARADIHDVVPRIIGSGMAIMIPASSKAMCGLWVILSIRMNTHNKDNYRIIKASVLIMSLFTESILWMSVSISQRNPRYTGKLFYLDDGFYIRIAVSVLFLSFFAFAVRDLVYLYKKNRQI